MYTHSLKYVLMVVPLPDLVEKYDVGVFLPEKQQLHAKLYI
jgi:hypothetical protein